MLHRIHLALTWPLNGIGSHFKHGHRGVTRQRHWPGAKREPRGHFSLSDYRQQADERQTPPIRSTQVVVKHVGTRLALSRNPPATSAILIHHAATVSMSGLREGRGQVRRG